MTLRLKLIVSIAIGMLATLVLGAAMIYLHAIDKVATEMQAAIAVGVRLAKHAAAEADRPADAGSRLASLVGQFDGDRHLQAKVLNSAGHVLMSSAVAAPEKHVPNWFHDLLKGQKHAVVVALPSGPGEADRLLLETSSRNEVGEVWDDMLKTLAILLVLTTSVTLIVSTVLGRALRPLEQLSDAFSRVANPITPVHITESGPAELRRLTSGFNEMVDRLIAAETTNRRLNEQLLSVEAEERADIARDLHDEIGPFLFAVDVDAASIGRLAAEQSYEQIPERVGRVREAVGHMQAHVKDMLARLKSAVLLDLGLTHALDNLVAFWLSRHPEISIAIEAGETSFGEALDATIYRLVQEALSNAVRHGRPRHVEIRVARGADGIDVTIADDGAGLAEDGRGGGFGIVGMRERVAAHNGRFSIANRAAGSGVIVSVWLPNPAPVNGIAGSKPMDGDVTT